MPSPASYLGAALICGVHIINFGMEMTMSENYPKSENHLNYLRREHARLDAEIQKQQRQRPPDEVLVARLKKLKLAIKDQIAGLCAELELDDSRAA